MDLHSVGVFLVGLGVGVLLAQIPRSHRTRVTRRLRAEAQGLVSHVKGLRDQRPWKMVKEQYDYQGRHVSKLRVYHSSRARLQVWWASTQPRYGQKREKVSSG
jgi:hypothetical protein